MGKKATVKKQKEVELEPEIEQSESVEISEEELLKQLCSDDNDDVSEEESEAISESESESDSEDEYSETNQKILISYNKYLSKFIKTHKNISEDVKSIVKKYKVIDNNSLEYMHCFDIESVSDVLYKQKLNRLEDITLFKNKSFLKLDIYNGITINHIYKKIESNLQKLELIKYIFIFHILKYLYNLGDNNYKQILFDKIIDVIDDSNIMNYNKYVENIVDDDISEIIKQFILLNILLNEEYKKQNKSSASENTNGNPEQHQDEFMASIEQSNIGKIAKEIMDEINIDEIQTENPQDLLKGLMGNGNDGQPPLFQKIFSTIGTKLTSKMENGELDINELKNDAFNIAEQMNNEDNQNNPFSNMFNQMLGPLGKGLGKGMGGRPRVNKDKLNREKARQRVRAKLEKRQKEQQ